MTTVPHRVEAFVVRALILMLVAGGSLSATAEAEAQSESKVRVAVMNFENNSTWTYWGNNLGYAAADELVTQLFGSGKFSLVERSQLDAVLAEQNLGQSGRVNSAQAADIGRILGVQLILTGSITKFSIDTKGGGFGGFGVEYSEAESNLDIRMIDTNTAEIMFADDGEGKVRLGEDCRPGRRLFLLEGPGGTGPDRRVGLGWHVLSRQGRELQRARGSAV